MTCLVHGTAFTAPNAVRLRPAAACVTWSEQGASSHLTRVAGCVQDEHGLPRLAGEDEALIAELAGCLGRWAAHCAPEVCRCLSLGPDSKARFVSDFVNGVGTSQLQCTAATTSHQHHFVVVARQELAAQLEVGPLAAPLPGPWPERLALVLTLASTSQHALPRCAALPMHHPPMPSSQTKSGSHLEIALLWRMKQ